MQLDLSIDLPEVVDETDPRAQAIIKGVSTPKPTWYTGSSVYKILWSGNPTSSHLTLFGSVAGDPWGSDADKAALDHVTEEIRSAIRAASGEPELRVDVYCWPAAEATE